MNKFGWDAKALNCRCILNLQQHEADCEDIKPAAAHQSFCSASGSHCPFAYARTLEVAMHCSTSLLLRLCMCMTCDKAAAHDSCSTQLPLLWHAACTHRTKLSKQPSKLMFCILQMQNMNVLRCLLTCGDLHELQSAFMIVPTFARSVQMAIYDRGPYPCACYKYCFVLLCGSIALAAASWESSCASTTHWLLGKSMFSMADCLSSM